MSFNSRQSCSFARDNANINIEATIVGVFVYITKIYIVSCRIFIVTMRVKYWKRLS